MTAAGSSGRRPPHRPWAWRSRLLLAVTLFGAAAMIGLWAPERASASCAGPQVWVGVGSTTPSPVSESGAPLVVRPGDRLVVRGALFHTGCEDTSSSGPGCGGPSPADRELPMTDVPLSVEQGAATWRLGITTAGPRSESYPVVFDVVVPGELTPGAATLRLGPVGVPLEVEG